MTEKATELEQRQRQAQQVIDTLFDYYGEAVCTLNYVDDPWRLLVGAILAAQCTDERVNKITPALFERFPAISDFAAVTPAEIEPYIKSCGIFRNKAKAIQGSAVMLLHEFDGAVPRERDALLRLPGVGRKIANLLIGDAFGGQAIVVDTHCGRISRLMGFTNHKDAAKIERDLVKVVPQKHWADWGHLLVAHGREICVARRPACDRCPIAHLCDTGLRYLADLSEAQVKSGDDGDVDGGAT
ncbi:MAG TPA: endonuclease III [Clostridiaceae bacterium]|nr:endonuclease III [Clostridiaceae bacterium]